MNIDNLKKKTKIITFDPKQTKGQHGQVLVSDSETFDDVINAVLYAAAFYLVPKFNMKRNRDLSYEVIQKHLKDLNFSDGAHGLCYVYVQLSACIW